MSDGHLPTGDRATWTSSLVTILSVVAMLGVMWGAMSKQVEHVPQMAEAIVELKNANTESRGEMRRLTDALKHQTEVLVSQRDAALARMEVRLSSMESRVEQLTTNMATIWPRLRAHGENISVLSRTIERLHPQHGAVQLKTPERF